MISESRCNFFASLATDLKTNPKRFWSIFTLSSKKSGIPQSVSIANNTSESPSRIVASTPDTIAKLFNHYFASVFHKKTTAPSVNTTPSTLLDERALSDISLTSGEVIAALKCLDVNKATGPDGIPNKLLKETSVEIAPSLCLLFNQSLESGVFPEEWKTANIVPVFKKGDKEFTENYRPISLLPTISKVFERCVLLKIRDHLQKYINRNQHGFVQGNSCVTQLVEVMEYIGVQLDKGKQTDVIYLDMSKALDKVDHGLLLEKLRNINIHGSLYSWFSSYLEGRKQRVTIPGAISHTLPVTSGVPQGSILGPMLFLLYVNDLPDSVRSSKVACFADDTKLVGKIDSYSDAVNLQKDIDNVETWSIQSGLQFNEVKTKVQSITRKRRALVYPYNIKGKPINMVEAERDLGVWITKAKQVVTQCSSANKLLGFVRRKVF